MADEKKSLDEKQQLLRSKEELRAWAESQIELQRRITAHMAALSDVMGQFALAALRGLLLIDGGAAVAILAFLRDDPTSPLAVALQESLFWSVAGAALAVCSAFVAYMSQAAFIKISKQRPGGTLGIIAGIAGLMSLGAFAVGVGHHRGRIESRACRTREIVPLPDRGGPTTRKIFCWLVSAVSREPNTCVLACSTMHPQRRR